MNRNPSHLPQVYIGTSGWSYSHWKENFYPKTVKPFQWLNYYADVFSTVEINTTFYHSPLISTVKKWYSQVPEHFLFSIKASRYLTHQKRLKDCKESLSFFYQNIQEFHSKTGSILFQLPPWFQMNKERLKEFISLLDDHYLYTFEFRHVSWFTSEIYEILSKNNIALCITDLNGKLTPHEMTANFTYIRLHGPQKAYQGSYGISKLNSWKKKIEKWLAADLSVYCYFDNDEKGYAIEDAKLMQELFKT